MPAATLRALRIRHLPGIPVNVQARDVKVVPSVCLLTGSWGTDPIMAITSHLPTNTLASRVGRLGIGQAIQALPHESHEQAAGLFGKLVAGCEQDSTDLVVIQTPSLIGKRITGYPGGKATRRRL
jgi:hypothetical protein